MSDRLSDRRIAGVIGRPIAHSLSPKIHRHWIAALDLPHDYAAFAPPGAGKFADAVRGAGALGLSGLNVTAPFKADALAIADDIDVTAAEAGAANLLTFDGAGRVRAANTDMQGFLSALEARRDLSALSQTPAVILGAGGAARGVVQALLKAGFRHIRLWNRTENRARDLVNALSEDHVRVHETWGATLMDGATLVVDTTSGLDERSWSGELAGRTAGAALFMDLKYGAGAAVFQNVAEAAGREFLDGLTMLIGQARPSFEAFFGAAPPEDGPALEAFLRGLRAR